MNSVTTPATFESRLFQIGLVRRLDRWLNVMPHPSMVVEIASDHVAAARWGNTRSYLESCAVEPLPVGAIMASPVETNVTQPDAVRSALRKVLARVPVRGTPLTLLVPDAVVRVFMLPFESLPRRADDALPLLRWRLKKSVPFDMDETVVSWMRQPGPQGNLEIVTAVARQRIIREYEEIVEELEARNCIVLSSTLATLPLLEEQGATMLIRMCGRSLTTVVVHGASLSVFRVSEMPAEAAQLNPQIMLEEIYPAIAYYQDTWGGTIDRVRIAGFGSKGEGFREALSQELHASAASLTDAEVVQGLDSPAKDMIHQNLDALVGWMMNEGS